MTASNAALLASFAGQVAVSPIYCTDSGTANAYVLSAPSTFSLVTGALVRFNPAHPNTGPSTANVGSVGIQNIVNQAGNALTGGEISVPTWMQWTGTAWQIVGTGPTPPYARTAAEISAGVIPTNYVYEPGDLRRYGCDVTGATDNSTQIQDAISCAVAAGGVGYIYHPGGTISHASQISVPNGLTVFGWSRAFCVFQFTGSPSTVPTYTRSAWRYASTSPNTSGYANVAFRHVKILYQNAVNFAAAIELNAGGFNYFEIDDVWVRGSCSYGIILDGVEIGSVHNCLIENINALSNYNIWIVNGPDRISDAITFTGALAQAATSATLSAAWGGATGTWVIFFSNGEQRNVTLTNGSTVVSWATQPGLTSTATANATAGQGPGFTNVITIRENQISSNSAVSIGLVDDGGNAHVVDGNNFNGHSVPAVFAACTGLKTGGNSYETPQQTGGGNVIFSAITQQNGNTVGPCTGCAIKSGGFYGNLGSGSLLRFNGSLNTITSITNAAQAVVTFSTASGVHPFCVGAPVSFSGVVGMTQINGQTGFVIAVGGSSGAWTATVAINTSGYSAYTSGGQGQMMHSGFTVSECNFGSQLGRGAAIDVTYLANSSCFDNTDLATTGGMSHYTGVHNDNNGNMLMPPQNGFSGGSIGVNGPTYGDTRFVSLFAGGIQSQGPLKPAAPNLTAQGGSLYAGVGMPSGANGNSGDYYLRTDTPSAANQRLYINTGGAWAGIL